MTKAAYDAGFLAGVKFALSHNEAHKTGLPVFTLTPIDPIKWWSEVILTPTPKFLPNSQAHFEARLDRWQVLASNFLAKEARYE